MLKHSRRGRLRGTPPAIALCALLAAVPSLAGIEMSIRPVVGCVQHQDSIVVNLLVDSSGTEFDGYDVTVHFDEDLLDVRRVYQDSTSIMKMLCAETPWFYTTQTDSTIFISHVVLCGGDGLVGPGILSSILFGASASPGDSPLRLVNARFFRGGYLVPDVVTHDGQLTVAEQCAGACCDEAGECVVRLEADCLLQGGQFLGPGIPCAPNACPNSGVRAGVRASPAWTARPNPFAIGTRLLYRSQPDRAPEGPVSVLIVDAAGRIVRSLEGATRGPAQEPIWDGCSDQGLPAPAGAYFARIRDGYGTTIVPIVRLR